MISDNYNIIDHVHCPDCPECGIYLFQNETSCPGCKLELDRIFFPETVATFHMEQWSWDIYTILKANGDLESDEENDFEELFEWFQGDVVSDIYEYGKLPAYVDNLCCNKSPKECDCAKSYTFGDGYLFYEDQYLTDYPGTKAEHAAYINDTMNDLPLCISCVHYASFSCKSFRTWLRLHIENPDLSDEDRPDHQIIEPCSEYEATQDTPPSEENYILSYIQKNTSGSPRSQLTSSVYSDMFDDDDEQYYFESLE